MLDVAGKVASDIARERARAEATTNGSNPIAEEGGESHDGEEGEGKTHNGDSVDDSNVTRNAANSGGDRLVAFATASTTGADDGLGPVISASSDVPPLRNIRGAGDGAAVVMQRDVYEHVLRPLFRKVELEELDAHAFDDTGALREGFGEVPREPGERRGEEEELSAIEDAVTAVSRLRWTSLVLGEYIASLHRFKLPVEAYLYEMLAHTAALLARKEGAGISSNRGSKRAADAGFSELRRLQMLLQYHTPPDSTHLAMLCAAGATTCRFAPLRQLAGDMVG